MTLNTASRSRMRDPFIRVPAALQTLAKPLTPSQLAVYLRVLWRAGQRGCFESVANMAKGCCLNPKTVRSALQALCDRNMLEAMERSGTTTVYEVTDIDEWLETPPPKTKQTNQPLPNEYRGTPTKRVQESTSNPYQTSAGVPLPNEYSTTPTNPVPRSTYLEELDLNEPNLIEPALTICAAPSEPQPVTPSDALVEVVPEKVKAPSPGTRCYEAYAAAYEDRYGTPPLRTAKINSILKNFSAAVPQHLWEAVCTHYVRHQDPHYVKAAHPVELMLRDVQRLVTEVTTNINTDSNKSKSSISAFEQQLRATGARSLI